MAYKLTPWEYSSSEGHRDSVCGYSPGYQVLQLHKVVSRNCNCRIVATVLPSGACLRSGTLCLGLQAGLQGATKKMPHGLTREGHITAATGQNHTQLPQW